MIEDIAKVVFNDDLTPMEKIFIIELNKDDFDPDYYDLAMSMLENSNYYCDCCGIYYDLDKCEFCEISKDLECKPPTRNSIFDYLVEKKPIIKTITIHTVKCPLGHKAILEHTED